MALSLDAAPTDRRPALRALVITLYGPRGVPFVEKVVRGLSLKKLAFELREPESPEDHRRWSPETGRLPVIEIGGERIHDSTNILLRVDELFPEPPLVDSDPRTARSQLRLVTWVDESLFWYWNRWQRIRAEQAGSGPSQAGEVPHEPGPAEPTADPPRPAGVSLRSWVATRIHRQQPAKQSEHERLRYEVAHRIDDLERLLSPRPFFYADRIGIADLAVYAMLSRLAEDDVPGARERLASRPALLDFLKRVEQETGE